MRRGSPVPRARLRVDWVRLVAALVSFTVLIGSGLAWVAFRSFTTHVPHGLPVPALAAGQHDLDAADQNILLVGDDHRPADHGDRRLGSLADPDPPPRPLIP